MLIPIQRFNEDLEGNNPENKVVDEPHKIDPSKSRIIVPHHGAFFADTVRIFRKSTGVEVDPSEIKVLYMDEFLTLKTGKMIGQIIQLKNTDNEEDYLLMAQMVGGRYSSFDSLIIKLIEENAIDNRLVEYASIQNLPDAFKPEPHKHKLSQTYGYHRLIYAIEEIKKAIITKDRAVHETLLKYFDDETQKVYADIEQAKQKAKEDIDAHAGRKDNPHNTDKNQVGLGLAPNYPPADIHVVIDGVSDETLVTPIGALQSMITNVVPLIQQHANRRDNPHNTDKEQIGLGLVFNARMATPQETVIGTSEELYVNPHGVKMHINTNAIQPLNDHIKRKDNPHNTDKEQIGLGLVFNGTFATVEQAKAGTASNCYLNPKLGSILIDHKLINPIDDHKADMDNPHNTNAGHIGLDKVPNMSFNELSAYFASTEHSHGYQDLPLSQQDVNKFNQAALDLAVTGSFDDMGDYANLRARGTRKEDVGLGKAPNMSQADFDNRYAAKGHSHPEYITRSEADNKYANKTIFPAVVSYAQNYANYAVKRHVLGESVPEPTKPTI